uniref:hypothetical protein n=1 Tax=Peribacillus muralis TaxID=264697 RepID=UPI001F166E5E
KSRGGSRIARGKRVPGVEINVQNIQAIKKVYKLDFHRVCIQSEGSLISEPFFVEKLICLMS